MNFDLAICNGTLVTASETFQADVGIRSGKIAVIGQNLQGKQMVDAQGWYVLPGAIDPHVHLEMPSGETTSSDTWESGTRAAACGGTTAVIDFVEPEEGQTLLDAFDERRDLAAAQTHIDFSLHMTLTNAEADTLVQIPEVVASGVTSFKLYTTYDGFKLNDEEFIRCCKEIQSAGGMALVHAENDSIVQNATQSVLSEGVVDPTGHPLSRPALAESEAVSRVIQLAQLTEVPVYIVHVSTAGGAKAVGEAIMSGWSVYGETCPQYLLLTDEEYQRPGFEGAKFVCSPPLRSPDDQLALWTALAGGSLHTIGTDHCPFYFKGQKDLGRENFTKIPGGLPGIQSRLALIYTFGVGQGRISLNQWVDVCSTAPAKIMGLYPQKGLIAPGADADLVLFDPDKAVTLTHEFLSENVDYTPYEGTQLEGYPVKTFSRGRLIAEHGQLVDSDHTGRFVPRKPEKLDV